MSASAIWTVHCDGCMHWSDASVRPVRRDSERIARANGWLVQTKPQGGQNFCPKCRAEPNSV